MKGITTQTIILILIGVLVIGIMAYLIYRAATTKGLSMFECKAKLIDICRMCKNTGWDESYMLDIAGTDDDPYAKIITPCSGYSEFFYWSDNCCCGSSCCGCPGTCGNMPWDCGVLGVG